MLYTGSGSPIPNDKPMEQFKASDGDWQSVKKLSEDFGDKICCTILELRDRVAALEAKRVAPVQVPPTTVPTPPPLSPSADSLWEARLHVYRQGLAAGYEQGLAAGRAEQQATTEPPTDPEPEPVHSQYFSGHGLIAGEIDRALAEGGWTPTPEPTPDPEPSPSPADGWLIAALEGIGLDGKTACFTLLLVARWLRSMGNFSAATNLEREANR